MSIARMIASNQEQVDQGIKALMSNPRNVSRSIGLDIITKRAPLANSTTVLLQLSDGTLCLIIQLLSFHNNYLPDSLYYFLSLPAFTFAGFGIKDTMPILKKDYGLVCKNTLEVGPSAWDHKRASNISILRSMHVPEFRSFSGFCNAELNLTGEMINLAVSNAYAAFRLGEDFLTI
ncbi:unnamed protein product [Microthlaspi erraticum]|uniref:3'-5' exonuclease domain-containing protein n=1 Tax=Microthlaspi erraticum TaxID=1685480 RepID=A0A6D2IZ18_9BRAS|nr:unnamed protein product [Microthlaspi erraticum]